MTNLYVLAGIFQREIDYSHDLGLALLLVRLLLAVLFIFQGYEKLFVIKIQGVVDAFGAPLEAHHVTRRLIYIAATYTSVVEFVGGILLVPGLFNVPVLGILGLDVVFVSIAFGLVQPMWDMKHIFPRFILIIILLAIPQYMDIFSLDFLLFNH